MNNELHYQFLEQLKQLPFIEQIILYGSRARGDHQPRSDIDIAIKCPQASHDDWVQALDIVDRADTLLKIDCVRLEKAKGLFKQRILQEGKTLYERSKNQR